MIEHEVDKEFTGPVTPAEIQEVFRWKLLNPDAILLERVGPKDTIGESKLIVPNAVKASRKTGGTAGRIIQIGKNAKTNLEELAGSEVKPGDTVTFSVYAPQPAGFTDKYGNPILPGFSDSRYACVEILHYKDVIGHIPGQD